jgi:hypothetical protein
MRMTQSNNQCMGAKIETHAIKVHVDTDDYEIEGYIHIKPGGYQSRLSDILNVKDVRFLPITCATCRNRRRPDEEPRQVKTMILRLETINMVVPVDEEGQPMAEEAGGYAGGANNPALS